MLNILDNLAQRPPFIFVDNFFISDANVLGTVQFTKEKFLLWDSLDFCELIESLAQLSGLYVASITSKYRGGYVAKISNLEFSGAVTYSRNDVFEIKSEIIGSQDSYYVYKCSATHKNMNVLSLEISLFLLENFPNSKINHIEVMTHPYSEKIYNLFEFVDNSFLVKFSKDAQFLTGHFPGYPVVPGVYIIKACIKAINKIYFSEKSLLPSQIKYVKFLDLVIPEECILIKIKRTSNLEFIVNVVSNNNKKALLHIIY